MSKKEKEDTESGGDSARLGDDSNLGKSFHDMRITGSRKTTKEFIFFGPRGVVSVNRLSELWVGVIGESNRKSSSGERIKIKADGVTYVTDRVVGNGSFGVVFQATCVPTGEVVAIKKVLQDRRFKNRELQIMRLLNHTNVVKLYNQFYVRGEKPDEVYLNLVLEYVPDTVYGVCRQYTKAKQQIPIIFCKLYTYQLARALAYIHSLGICHRDIKPQNLLLNPQTGVLKLCDFGSAKILVKGEANVSYICSRYYRSPELIFGSTDYETVIDVWSMGCVLGELLLGQPLFPGESGVDQLVEIIKVLGTPTWEQIQAMNPNYTDFKFPQIRPHPWEKVFGPHVPPEAINLITKLLVYTPSNRLSPLQTCAHPFFDELRDPEAKLPNGKPLPLLFNWSPQELLHVSKELLLTLIPAHARAEYTHRCQEWSLQTGQRANFLPDTATSSSTTNVSSAKASGSLSTSPPS